MKKLLHKSLRLLLWFAMLGFVAPLSVVAADCYIAGSFNGWNASATKLTQNGDQYEFTQKFDGGTQFKIVYNGSWYGYDAVKGGTDLVTSADGSYKNIQFNSTGCYGLFFKSNGELYITKRDDCPQAYKCDPANTIVVFKEDFGTLPDVDARASYSKQNVAVPGTTITYSASVPYTAETKSCAAMTNEGYYSVLANPRNAGCGTNVAQGVTNCNCYDSSERWYRITEDHTPGDTNGGMLMYNCADGTSKTDVLYECTIDGICANTYINFSAFVTCANTGRSGNIPIEAEFKLFNADTGAELSTSPVTNIGLSEEWKEISAMFNSADATRVKIQLINKADAGQGNDLLFDDMMLSVCTPEADLVCSDLTSTEKTIVRGGSETLTAEILSGIMSNPFYLWQYRTNKSNWLPLGDPQQNLENLTVTPETTPTYYRVILANTAQEALNIAGEGNPSVCGMYAITNTVTLYAANLNLTANLVDGNICADGVDANTYTLSVTNTTGTAVNNVKVNVSIPAQWVNLVSVASGSGYENGVWTIGKMNESETKTLTLTLKSDIDLTNLSETATLQAFVSQLESATWTTYAASPFNASNNMTVVAQTQVPTDVTPYDACTTPGTLEYANLVKVANPENLTFYETATSTTPIVSMSTNSVVSKYVYFTYTEDGKCASDRGKVKISISAQPTAQITSSEIQRVCAAEKHTFTISAVAANGSGSWSIVSGEASIANPDALTTTACVVAGQTAVLAWNVVNEKNCKATATTTLIVDKEPVVTIVDGKGSQKACGPTEFKVAVNPNVPVGSWQIVSGTATIVSPTNYETKITGVGDNKTVKVRYETGAYGQCASVKGPEISLTVNALPTAAFQSNRSEVCADAAELTNAQVTFTGNSAFDLTYQVNGGANITKTGLTSPYIIKEPLTANGTLQLVSVTDAKGCVGTITGQTHSVTADFYPTIKDIVKPGTICEGNELRLTVPSVEANGSTLGASGWVLNGASFDPSTILSANQDAQDLKYSVAYTCGRQAQSTIYSNVVSIAVDANPSAAVAGAAQTQCNNGTFTLAATAPAVGEGTWTLTSGSGTIADASSATSQVTDVPVNGSATLKWTVSNGVCPATTSSVVLTNNDCTNLNLTAGAAPVVCDGSQATFTFTLKNDSPVASTNVTATITLGAGLSDVDVTPSMGSVSGNTWTIPSMASGEQAVLTVLATATTANATVSVVVNEASSVAVTGVQASQSATVNALPTAAFQSNSSTICIDPQDKELTNIAVNFTDAAPFELTYVDSKGSTYVENNLPLSATLLNADLDADEAYTLVSVTDANGCVGTITGQTHQVSTQKHASLDVLVAPAPVCEGNTLTLVAPAVINNNGAIVSNEKWFLDGREFDATTSVTHDVHDGKALFYQITSSCNAIERNIASNSVDVTVYKTPELTVAFADPKGNAVTATQITCAVPYLTATLSGAESYTWSDGSTENPRTLGKKGGATTYEVSGVTDAGCVADALTFTITEDFATPDVAIAASDKTITCSVTEITLTASSNTAGVTYKWDDANETAGAIVKVATPNTYKVTATNSTNGCSATATETIGINTEKPVIVITSKDANGTATSTLNCTAEASTLTLIPSVTNVNSIGGPVTFVWDGDNTIPTERTVNEAKRYTVAATGANGCAASQFIDITLDDDVPTLDLTASATDITCLVQSSVLTAQATPSAGVTYAWNTNESGSQITVNAGGTYEVVATAVNGCTVTKSVTIDQHTDLPNVTISSTDPKQYCRVNTLTASGADKYVWSTNETTTSIEVSEGGEYWVEGTNAYGCSARAELNLENDKVAPVVAISSDINAITCTNTTATLTATVTNADDARTYSYQWSPKSGTNSTLRVTEGKTYKVVVTDGTNYCKGEKTITVAQHTEKPMVDVQTLPAVCLPATIDLAQAIGPNTLADNVVFYEDEALTKEITNTTIDLAQYNVFYVQGQQVNGNGCMGDAQPVAANVKAVTPAPVVKDYDECTKAGSEKFSSLVTSGYYKLNFYASENDETPIADAFDASASNTTTTYYVSNTNQGACESERVPFTVHIEGLVDFELEVSETNVLAGGNQVVVTLTPASVEVDQYKWMANGNVLPVEGEEYSANLYIDTKFEVAAKGRCNTLVKDAFVEVVWPTAFTPYNNNNLNETFAKGLPVQIFNRFGIQVFEGADGWDGVMNKNMGANMMAVPGVYYYSVSLPDGNVKKGTIEIVKF